MSNFYYFFSSLCAAGGCVWYLSAKLAELSQKLEDLNDTVCDLREDWYDTKVSARLAVLESVTRKKKAQ